MDLFRGVAGGAVRGGPADASAQVTRPAANTDSGKGNGGSGGSGGSPHPGPTALVVKNKLSAKDMREEKCEASRTRDFPAAEHEQLERVTKLLLSDFFNVFTGISQSNGRERPALTTMNRVVEGLLEKHRYAYNGMINRLSLEDREDVAFISHVATSLFEDRVTNWGRIASLIAFGAVVCQALKTNGRDKCVEQVGQEMSSYLVSHHGEWLLQNDAWDGFVEFFSVSDPESSVRNTLLALVGFAGVGATLAMLIR
ncbi:induced myeloid leukemia cell differentiation protein Mcl-1-like [Eucyclogobius newberryi]|uniref:induced myeloid leukemia cell differentiation protein Mcl-1-like n=1 Tax=Eucyclogobius newberryi TaxID=166745 RepID=UPI003B5B0732